MRPTSAEMSTVEQLQRFSGIVTVGVESNVSHISAVDTALQQQPESASTTTHEHKQEKQSGQREAARLLKAMAAVLEDDRDLKAWEIEPLEDVC
eukprot:SAG31_NODE_40410_length_281_cov_0.571429_1_plen_93_part_11